MSNSIDMRGKRFGRWTVEARVGTSSHREAQWRCRCDCGTVKIKTGSHMRDGRSRSCGCLQSEAVSTHGLSKDKRYKNWLRMIARCEDEGNKDYHRYGGRGIKICKRWRLGANGKSGVECFLEDMGPRPSPKHSLDRIDNDGNYEPSNCRWATQKEQNRNTRANHRIRFKGESLCIGEIAERYGIAPSVLRMRILKGERGAQLVRPAYSGERIKERHAAMVEHYRISRSTQAVGKAFNVSPSTAHRAIIKFELGLMETRPGRHKKIASEGRA